MSKTVVQPSTDLPKDQGKFDGKQGIFCLAVGAEKESTRSLALQIILGGGFNGINVAEQQGYAHGGVVTKSTGIVLS